jgi:bacterioferritin (cytochrome b1)
MIRCLLIGEEGHANRIEAQLSLIQQMGEAHYLAQQIKREDE